VPILPGLLSFDVVVQSSAQTSVAPEEHQWNISLLKGRFARLLDAYEQGWLPKTIVGPRLENVKRKFPQKTNGKLTGRNWTRNG
jgi:hypothetical protein